MNANFILVSFFKSEVGKNLFKSWLKSIETNYAFHCCFLFVSSICCHGLSIMEEVSNFLQVKSNFVLNSISDVSVEGH